MESVAVSKHQMFVFLKTTGSKQDDDFDNLPGIHKVSGNCRSVIGRTVMKHPS